MWGFLKWVGVVVAVIIVCLIALTVWRYPAAQERMRSEAAVAAIKAQKLTMDDVNGAHLPPPPDPSKVDATIEGIDANQNGIRDDVELAIFAKYPNSPKIRAAELQYAMEIQTYLTKVFDGDTWKAAMEQADRGNQCIGQTYPRDDIQEFYRVTNQRVQEVEDLVINIQERRRMKSSIEKFEVSFGLPAGPVCDVIDISSTPN